MIYWSLFWPIHHRLIIAWVIPDCPVVASVDFGSLYIFGPGTLLAHQSGIFDRYFYRVSKLYYIDWVSNQCMVRKEPEKSILLRPAFSPSVPLIISRNANRPKILCLPLTRRSWSKHHKGKKMFLFSTEGKYQDWTPEELNSNADICALESSPTLGFI